MLIAEKREFYRELKTLADLHKQPLTPDILNFYWETLSEFDLRDIKIAIRAHAKTESGRFMPKPFDIQSFLPHKKNQANNFEPKILEAEERYPHEYQKTQAELAELAAQKKIPLEQAAVVKMRERSPRIAEILSKFLRKSKTKPEADG